MSRDEDDINQSLAILFSTGLGERVMEPKYGSDLARFLFEPIDTSMKTFMKDLITDAILYFEPRIRLIELHLDPFPDEGRIDITLEYEIRGTNSRFNFVYPFYLAEGGDINSSPGQK